ncbi:MAG: porin family protein [Candidatus Aminicenantes bacterium]|nr:porin family protein [Candidatus Aminicenantes bacterium]
MKEDRFKNKKRFNPRYYLLVMFIIFSFFYPAKIHGLNLSFGLGAGYRQINDNYLNQIYGSGLVFIAYMQVDLTKFFSTEISYEGGYKKRAPIGLYQEPSILKISGIEISNGLSWRLNRLTPYVKLGAGYYFYRQDIESPYARYRVNHRHISWHGGSGFRFNLNSKFFIQAEFKYVFLKVKPFDFEVDLGGGRYILLFGFKI